MIECVRHRIPLVRLGKSVSVQLGLDIVISLKKSVNLRVMDMGLADRFPHMAK